MENYCKFIAKATSLLLSYFSRTSLVYSPTFDAPQRNLLFQGSRLGRPPRCLRRTEPECADPLLATPGRFVPGTSATSILGVSLPTPPWRRLKLNPTVHCYIDSLSLPHLYKFSCCVTIASLDGNLQLGQATPNFPRPQAHHGITHCTAVSIHQPHPLLMYDHYQYGVCIRDRCWHE